MAKQHNPVHLNILQTINGIGRILALTIIYEVGDINRFPSVQKFASYCRLVKCKAEAAVLLLRHNHNATQYLEKLQKRMSKAKALSALAHKLGRCVYYMLKKETVFDETRFLKR